MTSEDIAIKLTDHNNRIGSLQKRMDKAEKNIEAVNELAKSVGELAVQMRYMADEQREVKESVETLKQEPAENHKFLKQQIISCLISGIGGALVGAIMGLIIYGGVA